MADAGETKRKAEGDGQEPAPERKRVRRWDSDAPSGAAAPAAAAAAAPPPADKAKLAAIAQKQRELAEKLAKLRALKAAPAAVPAPPAPTAVPGAQERAAALASRAPGPAVAAPTQPRARPSALRLDASGREVDATGAPVVRPTVAVSTFKVNVRVNKAKAAAAAMDAARAAIAAEAAAAARGAHPPGYDPRVEARGGGTSSRDKPRALHFVEPGTLAAAADTGRIAAALRAALGGEAGGAARRAALRATQEAEARTRAAAYEAKGLAGAAATREMRPEAVPPFEWWDEHLLGGAPLDDVASGAAPTHTNKISVYVEHPIPAPPACEPPPPPPQPLRLTKKEQKKLRTQRRLAREQERQEMVRQGLLEPPPPKVKISNLMRVLGAEATADPTAVEASVRAQMAERQAAHDDRNAARQLTPAERKEKAARKLFEEARGGGGETVCAAYRVERLDHRLNEFKVILNAEENHLTGCGLKTELFALVIVEGARKAVARYTKLMTRRIDWGLKPERVEEEDAAAEEAAAAAEAAAPPNGATLVWTGVVLKPAFKRFKVELIRTAAGAAKFLEDLGLRHLWQLAAAGVSVE